MVCAAAAAQNLTTIALICFLDGPAAVAALDHRSRHNMQNWISSGRFRGESRPAAKLAGIGTLLRRATHRSKGLPISSPVAARVRRFEYRMRAAAYWPTEAQPQPEKILRELDAVLQLVQAAMLADRVNWPRSDLRKQCSRLVTRAKLRLDRMRSLVG